MRGVGPFFRKKNNVKNGRGRVRGRNNPFFLRAGIGFEIFFNAMPSDLLSPIQF